jgi:hypothetical protein
MEIVYVLVRDSCDWEDIVVFLTEENAIKMSIKYPMDRVEIFTKKDIEFGYTPTYEYIQNGKYFKTDTFISTVIL